MATRCASGRCCFLGKYLDARGQYLCMWCWSTEYESNPLDDVEVCFTLRRATPNHGFGVKTSGLTVTSVECGGPASVGGLHAGTILTHANGKELETIADLRRETEGKTEVEVRGVVTGSSSWRRGRVLEWSSTHREIEPDLPILVEIDGKRAMLTGRCRLMDSCRVSPWRVLPKVGDEVTFLVGWNRLDIVATVVVISNPPNAPSTPKTVLSSEGADGIEVAVREAGGEVGRDMVCLDHMAGSCKDGGVRCRNGLHLPAPTDKGAEPVAFYSTQPGATGNAEFRLGESGTVVFLLDGVAHPPSRELEYDGKFTVTVHGVEKKVAMAPYKTATVLPALQRLADAAGVAHNFPPSPRSDLLTRVDTATLARLQAQWSSQSGRGKLLQAWEVHNGPMKRLFEATAYNMSVCYKANATPPINTYRAVEEGSVLDVIANGFTPPGSYRGDTSISGFAVKADVAAGNSDGSFVMQCKVLLGESDDQSWLGHMSCYVLKQKKGKVQAYPQYLLQFQRSSSPLSHELVAMCKAGIRHMSSTPKSGERVKVLRKADKYGRCVRVMGLDLEAFSQSALEADVQDFFAGHEVLRVVADRQGGELGAFVQFEREISFEQLSELSLRRYHGQRRVVIEVLENESLFSLAPLRGAPPSEVTVVPEERNGRDEVEVVVAKVPKVAGPELALIDDVEVMVTLKRSTDQSQFGFEMAVGGTEVSMVEVESPASVGGLLPQMVVTHADGSAVSGEEDLQEKAKGKVTLQLRGVVRGDQRRTGLLREWRRMTGIVEPDLPIFLPAGVLGTSRRSVYVGDVRVARNGVADEASLCEGQRVEFVVRVEKGERPRLVATELVGLEGWKNPKAKKVRGKVMSAVEDIVTAEGGRAWRDAVCTYHLAHACKEKVRCEHGMHVNALRYPKPSETIRVRDLMLTVSEAKLRLLQEKWGQFRSDRLVQAWELRNEALEMRFRATLYNMTVRYGKKPDMIEGFHGTAERNVLSIATHGLDPLRRSGQLYGEGEYFAKDPSVSYGYCSGGSFMFLCQLILGDGTKDHTWVDSCKYYVLKQRDAMIQALPQYLLQFQKSKSPLAKVLAEEAGSAKDDHASFLAMQAEQKGGVKPCRDRTEAMMEATATRHLHLGWLDAKLLEKGEKALEEDVREFLKGHAVRSVVAERNAARLGAFVELEEAITQEQLGELNTRAYHGEHRITVDDESPRAVSESTKICPRLTGPSRYCRGWNLGGHALWYDSCKFQHPAKLSPLHKSVCRREQVARNTAKWDEVVGLLGKGLGGVQIVGMERIVNPELERQYENRVAYLRKKHGGVDERELWHGTNCNVLETILQTGLMCPADRAAAEACPVSGGKGLCTTLCGTDCQHCVEPHKWGKCHMFGLGIYLADDAAKSHRYVSAPQVDKKGRTVYTLLRCRANLGNPYLIESCLRDGDSMHDYTICRDPSAALTHVVQQWDNLKGHDSYYVKGLGNRAVAGRGVINSEYVVFHTFQVLPLYAIHYII